ncbi:MAG: O-antigen ligase family protein [candidate division WWE3 bacterium]|nr:O-antigen ligase family protein [candidate division WWE3 bacterium]
MKKVLSVLIFLIFALTSVTNQLQFSLISDNLIPIRIVLVIFLILSGGYFIYREKANSLKYIWSQLLKDRVLLVGTLLFIWRVLTVLVVGNYSSGLPMLIFWASILAFYVLFNRFSNVKAATYGLYLSVAVSVFIAIYQTVSFVGWGIQRFDLWGWQFPDGFRVPGLMLDSNHYGIFMVGGFFIISLYLLLKKKYLWTIICAFLTIGTYSLSSSRSALIGLLVGGLVTMVILALRRQYKVLVIFAVALGLGLTSGTAISKVIDIYTTNFLKTSIILHQEVGSKTAAKVADTLQNSNSESIQFEGAFNFLNNLLPSRVKRVFDSSAKSHLAMVEASVKLGLRYPVFGVGYGNFSTGLKKESDIYGPASQFDPRGLSMPKFPSHTLWGEQLAETGIVGLALFTILVILMFIKLIKKPGISGALLAGLWIAFLIFAIFYSANEEFYWLVPFLGILL